MSKHAAFMDEGTCFQVHTSIHTPLCPRWSSHERLHKTHDSTSDRQQQPCQYSPSASLSSSSVGQVCSPSIGSGITSVCKDSCFSGSAFIRTLMSSSILVTAFPAQIWKPIWWSHRNPKTHTITRNISLHGDGWMETESRSLPPFSQWLFAGTLSLCLCLAPEALLNLVPLLLIDYVPHSHEVHVFRVPIETLWLLSVPRFHTISTSNIVFHPFNS